MSESMKMMEPRHDGGDQPHLPLLSHDELLRFGRQLSLAEVGLAGQRRLAASSVLIAGAGGLGSPIAMYLAAAGVGRLGLVDFDRVDASNLHRQLLYGTGDIGRPKLDAARERLREINPHTELECHSFRLSRENALEIISRFDVVADGTDNFPARYLVNDACVLAGRPNVSGSIHRFDGQLSVYAHAEGPCYRCVFREPPPPHLVPTCAEAGVLGVVPGIVGTLQAMECIKLLLGIGQPLIGRMLILESLRMRFRTVDIARDPECPACGTRTLRELIDYHAFCGMEAPADAVPAISPADLAAIGNPHSTLIVDVREPHEWEEDRLPGAVLVPLGTLDDAHQWIRDRGGDVIVYCRSGARGERAARRLMQLGVQDVRNLAGGLQRYRMELGA